MKLKTLFIFMLEPFHFDNFSHRKWKLNKNQFIR